MKDALIQEFSRLAASPERDLATPALLIARLECPSLDPAPYLKQLDVMGAVARERLMASGCLQDARRSESAVEVERGHSIATKYGRDCTRQTKPIERWGRHPRHR